MTQHRQSKGRAQERGAIIFLVAVVMMTLIAFAGLGIDSSFFYYYKRREQTAADSGAIAGAQELLRGNSGGVTAAARKDAGLNRFTHGSQGIDVTVNNPPVSGPRAGNSNFVEVIVSQPRNTWFLRALGIDSATPRARAVAGLADSEACVYVLNRDTSNPNNGFFANGTTSSTFSCGIYSNANFRATGGGCVVAPSLSYSGTYSNASSADSNCGPVEPGHGVPTVDPLANRYALPATSPCGFNNYKKTSGAVTLVPGIYCGGIDIGGSVSSATFTPGNYVLVGGGLKIGSSANATGTGVTFFNTFPGTQTNKYNAVIINTSGKVTFSAPTSGSTKALLFYQDPRVSWAANNGSTITAGSASTFEGILYFPSTDLTYSGNSSTSATGGYTLFVAYNLKIAGNSDINADFSSIGGSSPFQMAAFVE